MALPTGNPVGRPPDPKRPADVLLNPQLYKFARGQFKTMQNLSMDLKRLDIDATVSGTRSPVNQKRFLHPLLQLFYKFMSEYRKAAADNDADSAIKCLNSAMKLLESTAIKVDRAAQEAMRLNMEILRLKGRGWIKKEDIEESDSELIAEAKRMGIPVSDLLEADESVDDDEEDGD